MNEKSSVKYFTLIAITFIHSFCYSQKSENFCSKNDDSSVYFMIRKESALTLNILKENKFLLIINGTNYIKSYSHGLLKRNGDSILFQFDSVKLSEKKYSKASFIYFENIFAIKDDRCIYLLSKHPFVRRAKSKY